MVPLATVSKTVKKHEWLANKNVKKTYILCQTHFAVCYELTLAKTEDISS
jgi:hypothetical protein